MQLLEVLCYFRLRVPPGKITVGLGEAQLGQFVLDLGASEGLGKKDHIRMIPLDSVDHPCPEPEGVGVGIVGPEEAHPRVNPEGEDTPELPPQLPPLLRIELEGEDILVLFGWVFG